MPARALVLFPAALAAMVFLSSAAAAAGPPGPRSTPNGQVSNRRVGCDEVISTLDNDKNLWRGRQVSVSALAKTLGTRPEWVERCIIAHGRVVPKRAEEASGESSPEDRLERLEEEEAEEIAPEEVEEPGGEQEPPEKPPHTPRPTPNTGRLEGY